jgi:hypothetical protein
MSSIFDIFSDQPAKDAAAAQIAGINTGTNLATGNINQGIGAITTDYGAALAPYTQNYGTATAGTNQLGNVLGLNGATGSDAALTTLRNTPGYKFQQGTLDDTVNAAAAANGTLNSGNQLLALNKVNQGLADSTYNNYVQQLQPYLGASNAAAGGIAGVNTGMGSAVAGQQDTLANLNYTGQTGIGNANANADLSAYNASGNFWNMLGGLGGMKTAGGGTVGGNAVGGIGSALSSAGPAIMSMFSDERLKEDVQPVGKLYDGTDVYRYKMKGQPGHQIGLIAQDVEQTKPHAVGEQAGYKTVDYKKATDGAAGMSFADLLQGFINGAKSQYDQGKWIVGGMNGPAPAPYAGGPDYPAKDDANAYVRNNWPSPNADYGSRMMNFGRVGG